MRSARETVAALAAALAFLAYAQAVHAGGKGEAKGGKGGGGQESHGGVAVVCRAGNGSVEAVELLDLFEGRVLHGLSYKDRFASVGEVIARIPDDHGPAGVLRGELNQALALQARDWTISRKQADFARLADTFPIVQKKGCRFEQVANYGDDGFLRVNADLYPKLDHLNRVALQFHELAYKVDRLAVDAQDSQRARSLTAWMMADGLSEEQLTEFAFRHYLYYYGARARPVTELRLAQAFDLLMMARDVECRLGPTGRIRLHLLREPGRLQRYVAARPSSGPSPLKPGVALSLSSGQTFPVEGYYVFSSRDRQGKQMELAIDPNGFEAKSPLDRPRIHARFGNASIQCGVLP